jgi:hypothetical protein
MQAVTAHNNIVVADSPPSTTRRFEYKYRPYETGTINYAVDTSSANIQVEVDEDSSLATMLASEAILARDWATPEEDEAWANL